ncbi:MAG: hypothetical protein R3A78_14620 [Polyangiales bacterium]|nr:hypothetical protein [Myxococcales bacterium]
MTLNRRRSFETALCVGLVALALLAGCDDSSSGNGGYTIDRSGADGGDSDAGDSGDGDMSVVIDGQSLSAAVTAYVAEREEIIANDSEILSGWCLWSLYTAAIGGEMPPDPPANVDACEAGVTACESDNAADVAMVRSQLEVNAIALYTYLSGKTGQLTVAELEACFDAQNAELERRLMLTCGATVANPATVMTQVLEACEGVLQ